MKRLNQIKRLFFVTGLLCCGFGGLVWGQSPDIPPQHVVSFLLDSGVYSGSSAWHERQRRSLRSLALAVIGSLRSRHGSLCSRHWSLISLSFTHDQ